MRSLFPNFPKKSKDFGLKTSTYFGQNLLGQYYTTNEKQTIHREYFLINIF